MSKFQVKLNQSNSIRSMDTSRINGVSNQRTFYASGPKGVNRHLKDGEVFEDSNYWKKYCQPYCSAEEALLVILEDDGSVYSENSKRPMIFNHNIDAQSNCSSKYKINSHDTCKGVIATAQITNRSLEHTLKIKFNNSSNAVLEFLPGETQSFGSEDFAIEQIDFINESHDNVKVQILISVISESKS